MSNYELYYHGSYGTHILYASSLTEMLLMIEVLNIQMNPQNSHYDQQLRQLLQSDDIDVRAMFRKSMLSEHFIKTLMESHSYLSEIRKDGSPYTLKHIDWTNVAYEVVRYAVLTDSLYRLPFLLQGFDVSDTSKEVWDALWSKPELLQVMDVSIMEAIHTLELSPSSDLQEIPLSL